MEQSKISLEFSKKLKVGLVICMKNLLLLEKFHKTL